MLDCSALREGRCTSKQLSCLLSRTAPAILVEHKNTNTPEMPARALKTEAQVPAQQLARITRGQEQRAKVNLVSLELQGGIKDMTHVETSGFSSLSTTKTH